jgi:hypothetical protein
MKNLFSLFFLKANATKHLLCLLFLIAFIAPIGSKAQSSFTCSFGNPDGPDVIPCGSVVTATITFPANIENITLTFPNSFQVTTPINGAVFDATLSSGSLCTVNFLTANLTSPMTVAFAYRGCNEWDNGANANTSNLFFDCVGNNEILNADIINPTVGNGLTMFAGESATANHSTLPPITITTMQTGTLSGTALSTYERVFTVTINSLSIVSFDLSIINESDVELINQNQLTIDPTTNINFIYGGAFNTILLTDYSANVIQADGIRTLTFRQPVKRVCGSGSQLLTSVTARLNCVCDVANSGFYSSSIILNSVVTNPIEFQNISSNLTPDLLTTSGCTGVYYYDVRFRITSGTPNFQSIQIPINISNFEVTDVFFAEFSSFTPPLASFISTTYVNGSISLPPGWTFNSSTNFYTIRLKLNYTCSNTPDCESTTFTLTPTTNNNITFYLISTCNSLYSIEEELPEITEPLSAPTTIIGGATNFSYVIIPNGLVPFNYQFTLPTTSPFSMIYSANNNTVFDCQNVSYRAVLSLDGATFDTQSITDLNISNIAGINTTIAVSDGKFIIDLPLNPVHPGVYDIDFNLEGISCPPSPNNATFGSYTFQLSIQAICDDCNTATEPPCVRNVACASDLLFVHCPGDCDGLIGIKPDVTINRSTFGWANEAAYAANTAPIINESFFDNLDADEKDRQLHRLYPFDIFTVNAEGELKNYFTSQPGQFYTHNWVGFRINFTNTNLGEDFFNLIDYTITFSPVGQVGQTDIVINDLASVAIVPLGALGVAGLPTTMFQQELRWTIPEGSVLNQGTWNITFTARFRVTATSQTVDIGFYPLDFQCQFISESYLEPAYPSTFTSCDPYGASILVLIPEVLVAQQSVQTFDNTSTGNLLVNTNSVNEISNNACSFNHIIGLRHRGGLGDAVDDFPFEFRPLSAWGNTVSANILIDVDELYPPVSNTFTGTAGSFTNTNTNLRLLPAMEKGDIENNFQGLNLKLDKNCTNSISSIPLSLQGTKNYAYLHQNFDFSSDASLNQDLINQEQLLTFNNAAIPASGAYFSIPSLIDLLPSTILIPNGTSTFDFQLNSNSGVLNGIPTAFSASVVLPAGAPPGSVTLSNFTFDGVINASGNLVGFTNGIPNINASFDINLGNNFGCFDQEFQIQFTFYVFCNEDQLNDFISGNGNSCPNPVPSEAPLRNYRSITRTFKRAITSLAQANTTNNFEQDDCNLIWNLQVTNPSLIPIDVSTLNLNFATGLIYNSGEVSMNCGPNPPDNSNPPTILSLSNPSFQFITDNFNNSSIQTTLGIQGFGAGLPLLLLQPGCTLNYRLNFSTTNEICSLPSFDNTNIINANFTYSNICNDDTETPTNDGLMTMPIAVNNGGTNLSNIMTQLSNGVNAIGSPCCVASSFVVQHACGTTEGSITYNNTDPVNSVVLTLYQVGNTTPSSNTIPANSTQSINVLEGSYGITVFNGTTGAFFTADISIENHGFTAVLSDVTICDGQNSILVPTLDPTTPPAGLVYTYEWNTLETTETITVNSAATYSVIISNGSCSASAVSVITVNPIPVMTNLSIKNICSGSNIEIELTADLPSNFSWTIGTITGGITGASSGSGSTIDQILVNPSNATAGTIEYIVTPTATLGPCIGVPFIITVTVYPMPTLSSALTASICNNTLFSYSPISSILGATLTWTRAAVTGITNAAIITPQSSNPNETLSLTSGTTTPVNVVYVYTIQTDECRNNVNVTVTVNPITNNSVSISANTGNSICSETPVTFTAAAINGGINPTYNWTVNGISAGNTTESFITTALTGIANVQVSMTSSFVCANPLTAVSNNIIVTVIPSNSPLCQCACTDPTTGATFPSLPITSFTQLINDYTSNISNKCLYFQDDISITSNLTLQNCIITVAPGKRIVVEENINFAAINNTFQGCEQMWVGIQNRGRVKFIGNTIRDARIGFEMVRVTSSFPFTWLDGITFSNNFIGLSNSWALGNHRFAGPNNCVFEGGGLKPGYAGQIPAPNLAGGLAGMRVQRRFIVAINQTNKFSNLYNGLLVLSSTVKVDGALFENIKGTNLYPNNNVPLGTSLLTFLQTYSNHPRFPSAAINASYGSQVGINGLGSEQGSTPMFFGCTRSICSHAGRMGVSNVFIDGDDDNPAWIGMYFLGNSNANSFNVQNNRIRTNQTGILLLENGANTGGINSAVVTNNNITVLDHFDLSPSVNSGAWKAGIYSSSLLNTDARRSQISNNTINIRSMNRTDGILTLTSNGIGINNNLIRRFTPSTGSGIDIQNNLMAKIECNSSLGMSTDVMSAQNQAYSVFGSNFTLRENYSNLTRNGFALFGDCTDIQFYRNQMGQHQNIGINSDPNGALYISSSAVLGPQQDRFNLFLNGNYAFRVPGFNSAFNVFLVDNSQMAANPALYPLHDPADPDNQCAPDPFFRCLDNLDINELIGEPCGIAGSSVVGSMRTNPIGAEGIAAALINGELNFDTYNEESKFEVSKSIVRGIKDQTINLPNTPIYENWKDSIAQSNTSSLTESAIKWRKENYSDNHKQMADEWKASATESYDFAMAYFENIQQPEDYDNPTNIQEYLELLNKEEIANNLLEILKQLNDSNTQEKIDSTAYWNNLVIDPTDYEELERIINEIYLNTLAKREFEFSASQWYQISQIAFLCPLKSASAVYKARGMYSIVDPTANFDDYSICLNQGMQYRTTNTQQNNVDGDITIKQLDQTLQVNYTGKSSLQSIRVLNNLGQILTQWQSATTNSQQQTINLSNLNIQNGLYILQAQSANGKFSNRKFIYTK